MLEEYLNVDTSENVQFDFEVAGIGSRFIAALFDTLIVVLILILLGIGVFLTIIALDDRDWGVAIISAIGVLLSFVVIWGYYITFEIAWNGQTPGKRWVGIRTIRADGMPAGPYEIIIRNLMRLVDILPGTYGIGLIAMFINQRSRRLGDIAAGTLVVFDQTALNLDDIQANRPADIPISDSLRSLPIHLIEDRTVELGVGLLARTEEIRNVDLVSRQILGKMYAEMGLADSAESQIEFEGNPLHHLRQICAMVQKRSSS